MKVQNPTKYSISTLKEALNRGKEAIQEAGEIMVALVDSDPRIYEKIIRDDPSLSLNLLVTLEKIGRGMIYGALLFDSSPGARKLLDLPASQQREHYENPVKVVSIKDGKKVETEKPIQQLTPSEVRVVFAEDRMRTSTEQAKVLEVVNHRSPAKPAQRYEIKTNGNLVIHSETEFTPSQLEEVYDRVKSKYIKSLATK